MPKLNSPGPRGAHVFVDETKSNGYLLVAAFVLPRHLSEARRTMRSLLLPRQSRLHFQKESPRRRSLIVSTVCGLNAPVVIYDASAHKNQREARTACLRRLVADLSRAGASRLVIEQDDSLIGADQRDLSDAVYQARALRLTYEHLPGQADPLLWIADSVAWCWSRGGHWRQRVQPLIAATIKV